MESSNRQPCPLQAAMVVSLMKERFCLLYTSRCVYETDNEVTISIKNVSRNELNISADELMERLSLIHI